MIQKTQIPTPTNGAGKADPRVPFHLIHGVSKVRQIDETLFFRARDRVIDEFPEPLVLRQCQRFEVGVLSYRNQRGAWPAVLGDHDRSALGQLLNVAAKPRLYLAKVLDLHMIAVLCRPLSYPF